MVEMDGNGADWDGVEIVLRRWGVMVLRGCGWDGWKWC